MDKILLILTKIILYPIVWVLYIFGNIFHYLGEAVGWILCKLYGIGEKI